MVSFDYPGEDSTLGAILQHYLLQLNNITYAGYKVNEDTKVMTLHVEGTDLEGSIKLAARHARECVENI